MSAPAKVRLGSTGPSTEKGPQLSNFKAKMVGGLFCHVKIYCRSNLVKLFFLVF